MHSLPNDAAFYSYRTSLGNKPVLVSLRKGMPRYNGLHAVGTTSRQRAIRNTDDAVSLMVRARDLEIPCILFSESPCNPKNTMECGHFIERGIEATRFHPMNVNKECASHNSSHVSGFRPDKGFPYGLAIDKKYGNGAALFLYRLAHPLHTKELTPQDSFTEIELDLLKDAARKGPRVYEQIYYTMRPAARFIPKAA
jgi:hypothetical protein